MNSVLKPDVSEAVKEIKSTRTEVCSSTLYDKLIANKLTSDERWLIATAIKRIATKENITTGLFVFTEKIYWDLDKKEPNNF